MLAPTSASVYSWVLVPLTLCAIAVLQIYIEQLADSAWPSRPFSLRPLERLIFFWSFYLPPILYLAGSFANYLHPPMWRWWCAVALPSHVLGMTSVAALNILAQLVTAWCWFFLFAACKQLRQQILQMYIGRGGGPVIPSTGPYSFIRHPIYCTLLVQQLLFAVLCWSYLPVVTFSVTASMLVLKIVREEHLHMSDPLAGREYAAYSRTVRTRLIPGLW